MGTKPAHANVDTDTKNRLSSYLIHLFFLCVLCAFAVNPSF